MTAVYVDIGSNVNPAENVAACAVALRAAYPGIRFSKPYSSKAEGFDGDDFINMSAGFETPLSYQEVRSFLRKIEADQCRVRREGKKFSSRSLDVDILLFGDEILKPDYDVLRAEILKFPFVLFPLAEIAAEVIHPELNITIAEIAAASQLDRGNIWPVELIQETK